MAQVNKAKKAKKTAAPKMGLGRGLSSLMNTREASYDEVAMVEKNGKECEYPKRIAGRVLGNQ